MFRTLIFYILLAGLAGCNESPDTTCIDKNCSDYSTQSAAQADFELYPECRNDLDADNDSIACEQWFGEDEVPDDCPTTANCGCSNRRKAECESNCCRWVIGQGCRCS